jgi:hypothetical protein
MERKLTYAERLNVVVGWMDRLGYVYCPGCLGLERGAVPVIPSRSAWEPMRPPNLGSGDDECDGCHQRLMPEGLFPPLGDR